MNIKIIKTITVLTAAVLLISATAAGAVSITRIEAYLAEDFNFRVDGEAWSPKDVDGSDLTPIVYNDRTYVPVRSLLEEKGVGVDWDDDTRTVILDYSTIKEIDKASPLLLINDFGDTDSDDDGLDDGTETYLVRGNPVYEDDGNVSVNPMYEFAVNNDTRIWVDGEKLTSSIDVLIRLKSQWEASETNVAVDSESGVARTVVITTGGDGNVLTEVSEDEDDKEKPRKLKITYAPIFEF